MTMHNEFTRIDERFTALSYDELMDAIERGRQMRSRAMHDYMVGLGGLLRRTFEKRGVKSSVKTGHRPLGARHA